MSFNKDLFEQHLKNKDYDFCITYLRNEIIEILTKMVQEKEPEFEYSTIKSLQTKCFKYLSEKECHIVSELYDFSFNDDLPHYELSRMLEIYKELI